MIAGDRNWQGKHIEPVEVVLASGSLLLIASGLPAKERRAEGAWRSMELLDVAFAIDDAFSITMPIDQWLQAVHVGRVPADQYFVLKEFCAHIDDLTAAAST